MNITPKFMLKAKDIKHKINAARPGTPEWVELTHIIGEIYQTPEYLLAWAKKLHSAGQNDLANSFARKAVLHTKPDGPKVEKKLSKIAMVMASINQTTDAIAILKQLNETGHSNIVTANKLGSIYVHDNNPKAAIALLKPLHETGRGDIFTANTLGNAYLHDNDPKAAIALLKPLYETGRNLVTANTLGNAYLHDNDPKAAIALLKPLYETGCDNLVTANTLAKAYLYDNDPKAAIALLKPLHETRRGDIITANTLGNAYLHDGNPREAIDVLQRLQDNRSGNIVTTGTLANAYVSICDRRGFETIMPMIQGKSDIDYLSAKLYFFENDTRRATAILSSYIQRDIRTVSISMTSLYMACIGDESPLLDTIKKVVGKSHFDYLLDRRDKWRKNPTRTELADTKLSNGHILFELGGVPASKADRAKAGLGRETPVAAAPGLWRK